MSLAPIFEEVGFNDKGDVTSYNNFNFLYLHLCNLNYKISMP